MLQLPLGGQGSPMVLQVKFPVVFRKFRPEFLQTGKEFVNAPPCGLGRSGKVFEPPCPFAHFRGDPAPAVAIPAGHEELIMDVRLPVLGSALADFARRHVHIEPEVLGDMGKDLRTV